MAGPSFLAKRIDAIKAVSFNYGKAQGRAGSSNTLYGYPRFDNLQDPWPRTQYNGSGETWDPATSAGNVADNSAVVICLGAIADAFPEPRLQVVELNAEGNWEPVEDHPALDLLAEPNQVDDFDRLSIAWAMAYKVDGNAYFALTRTRGGEIAQIDYVPPDKMRLESDSPTVAISRYVYCVDGKEISYPPEDVIHWRDGKDPADPRLGFARLKRIILEIASDNEGSRYTAAILHNMGVAGGMLTYEDDELSMTKEIVEKIKAYWRAAISGSNRGGLVVPTFKAKYQDIGRSPQEMALGDIRQIPEARIAACLRVPAMVAGLTSGSESKSYANYAEAREAFWEECIVPLQNRYTAGLTRYLLPQFGDEIRGTRRRRFRYCYDEVRAFQPDLDKVSARKTKEWLSDGITLDELREGVGEKPLEDEAQGGKYYSEHAGEMKPQPVLPEGPDSPGDRAATAQNATGRTMPFGSKKALAAVNGNGHAAKATTFEHEGTEYVTTDADVLQVATEAFGSLESFWEARRERWAHLLEDDGPATKGSPNQLRAPRGVSNGGQWISHGGGSAGVIVMREHGPVSLRPATDADRKKYGIPPGYTDAKVADKAEEGSPLVWTATTGTGAQKNGYSVAYMTAQDAGKFERVRDLNHAVPEARAKWAAEIESGGKRKEEATVLRLIEQVGFRNGGEDAQTGIIRRGSDGKPLKDAEGKLIRDYAPTYGASTLRSEHARVDGDKVHFDFVGKSGVRQRHTVADPLIAAHVRERQASGATELFATNDTKVLAHLKQSSGGDYKVHDLRTRHATLTAAAVMERIDARGETPRTAAALKTQRQRAINVAARRIGDSRGVAEKKYVDPKVFDRWAVGISEAE